MAFLRHEQITIFRQLRPRSERPKASGDSGPLMWRRMPPRPQANRPTAFSRLRNNSRGRPIVAALAKIERLVTFSVAIGQRRGHGRTVHMLFAAQGVRQTGGRGSKASVDWQNASVVASGPKPSALGCLRNQSPFAVSAEVRAQGPQRSARPIKRASVGGGRRRHRYRAPRPARFDRPSAGRRRCLWRDRLATVPSWRSANPRGQ